MRTALPLALALLAAAPAPAETLVAARVLRAQTVLSAADVTLDGQTVPGALTDPRDAIGLETRTAIYPGRPILLADLGPPAIIERNQTVPLAYHRGPLDIRTAGRALDRGGVGDTIRVMNTTSKAIVLATIAADGSTQVQSQ